MRPEDVVAFAAGAAAVPLWEARKKPEKNSDDPSSFTRDEISIMYVHDKLLDVQKRVNGTRDGTTYAKLSDVQKDDFRKGFMAFLKAKGFISKSREFAKVAKTGADWPAAALAGLFSGAVLQTTNDYLIQRRDVQAMEYSEGLERKYKELFGGYESTKSSNDLRVTTVKLVVHTFVWREFPQDLGKCYQGLEKLEDQDVDDCFAVMSKIHPVLPSMVTHTVSQNPT